MDSPKYIYMCVYVCQFDDAIAAIDIVSNGKRIVQIQTWP